MTTNLEQVSCDVDRGVRTEIQARSFSTIATKRGPRCSSPQHEHKGASTASSTNTFSSKLRVAP
eukprot:9499226-Prorocentrum_lima.AAC.1